MSQKLIDYKLKLKTARVTMLRKRRAEQLRRSSNWSLNKDGNWIKSNLIIPTYSESRSTYKQEVRKIFNGK